MILIIRDLSPGLYFAIVHYHSTDGSFVYYLFSLLALQQEFAYLHSVFCSPYDESTKRFIRCVQDSMYFFNLRVLWLFVVLENLHRFSLKTLPLTLFFFLLKFPLDQNWNFSFNPPYLLTSLLDFIPFYLFLQHSGHTFHITNSLNCANLLFKLAIVFNFIHNFSF